MIPLGLHTAVSTAMTVSHFLSLPAATDGLTETGCTKKALSLDKGSSI